MLVGGLPTGVVPADGTSVGVTPLRAGHGRCPCGLAAAGHPYSCPGRQLSPLQGACPLMAAFAVKIQEEHIEHFYMIQSHHT
ncbi:hypothetical protein B296_00007833 [Ensete ventricosum]|uniref:Uncharacterized protein n=1 Tax=Ensete ventricosum TaxID=4639 RepID=A0A426YG75_ENSVE|nr:hypothetical protein B296_00007833 [Ensete ventricosum]